jgi:hypothetical protein
MPPESLWPQIKQQHQRNTISSDFDREREREREIEANPQEYIKMPRYRDECNVQTKGGSPSSL